MGNLFVILGINLAILFLIFLYFRSRLIRMLKSHFILDKIRDEVDEMIIELNQTTNRNIGIIEERLKRLSELTALADKSILTLSRSVEQKKEEIHVYSELKKNVPVSPQENIRRFPEELTMGQRVLQMYREGIPKEKIARNLDKTLGEVELMLSLELRRET